MVRKLAVVVLAVAMVMSCMGLASAAKFPDTAGHKQEAAIDRIASLGLVKGYPDGTFKPDAPITRAEFAKVMVCALGLEAAAEMMATTPTVFADVPVGYWATGYINVAASQGIVNGYPDGTFKPDANVTYAEALKMILCALGYRPEVFRTIVWPVTWVAKAMELGLTSGVPLATGAAALPANRGDVARLVDNALTVDKLVQKGYGDEITYEVKEGETLLKDLGYHKVTPRIVDIYLTDADLAENEVKGSDGETYVLPEGADVVALLGLEVKMWADDDGNVSHYEVATAADKVLYDSVASADSSEVELLVKDKSYDWADSPAVLVNFADKGKGDVAEGQYGRFVLDDKGKVAFAVLFSFSEPKAGLVTEVSESKIKYLDRASAKELKLSKYDSVTVYDAKLAAMKVADIKADQLLYGWASGDDLYLIVAGDKKEGELESARDDRLGLDGTTYSYGDYATFSLNEDEDVDVLDAAGDIGDLLGETVVVIVDITGQVRHVRGDVATTTALQFGVGLKGSPAGVDTPAKIKILGSDGTAKTYAFETEEDYEDIFGTGAWDGNALVAFKLNADGEIADGQIALLSDGDWDFPTGSDIGSALSEYRVLGVGLDPTAVDDEDDSITFDEGTVYVTGDTVIFSEIADDADVDVVAWKDIESMDVTGTGITLTVVQTAKGADAVVVYFNSGFDQVQVAEKFYGVVLDDAWLTSAGWKTKINVYGEGEKEYVLAASGLRAEAKEGRVVSFTLSAEGKVKDVVYAEELATDEIASGTILDISGKYVSVEAGKWVRVADDAVLYRLDEDGYIDEEISYSDLEKNMQVTYAIKAGKIVALTVGEAPAPQPETTAPKFTAIQVWAGSPLVKLQFSEKIKEVSTGAVTQSDFAATVAGAPVPVKRVVQAPDGTTDAFLVELELAPVSGQTVSVTIKNPADIVDVDGTPLDEAVLTRSATP